MNSDDFYKNLPVVPIGVGLVDFAHHHEVPDDWTVVIVDIIGSTKAVQEGRYKDVNIAASCSIIAVLNRVGRDQIAYIYGGDGATFLIPSRLKFDVASAVHGAREMARESFKLDMRAGMVDVSELREKGATVRLAKVETKPGVRQAALSGGGIALAEKLVKDKELVQQYHISPLYGDNKLSAIPASFEGFECRWEPLKSRNGVDVSVIVLAQDNIGISDSDLYRDVLDNINRICGGHEDWQPASVENLKVAASPLKLRGEGKVRTFGKKASEKFAYWKHMVIMTWAGIYFIHYSKKGGNFDGATYRQETAKNSDFIKFDNTLRLVMDITKESRAKLEEYLEDLYRKGQIFYGVYAADAALMTCLVFNYADDHFHFIDGADGGYSLAAKQMKEQIAATKAQAA